jgi:RND family efflux transporter MFP subunit
MRSLVALLVLLTACPDPGEPHDHADEHPPGHDHHQEEGGHGEREVGAITRWTARHELFAEHTLPGDGEKIEVLAHVTVLDGFSPLSQGSLQLEIGGVVVARADRPERPGTFELSFAPKTGSPLVGRLVITSSRATDSFEDLRFDVAPSAEEPVGITFLKEQQWVVPFATEFAREETIVPTIEVSGEVTTPPGGSAEIGAPVNGRIVVEGSAFPRPGDPIRKGQLLAMLAPAPSSPEEAARATLAVKEAEARAAAAKSALERAERLMSDRAISLKDFEDARREANLAQDALRAARSAESMFTSASSGRARGAWKIASPITGTLAEVHASPGQSVASGALLFRVIDISELWIRARIPEQEASRLAPEENAAYQIAGLDAWSTLDVKGADKNAALVHTGTMVDAATRTVEVIYRLAARDPNLRVGGLVRVSLPVGRSWTGVTVPHGAVLDEDGRAIAYVQREGELFQERTLRLGPRSGGRVGVESGLDAKERVVSSGAHLVRLAARAPSAEPHGHIH